MDFTMGYSNWNIFLTNLSINNVQSQGVVALKECSKDPSRPAFVGLRAEQTKYFFLLLHQACGMLTKRQVAYRANEVAPLEWDRDIRTRIGPIPYQRR